MFLYRTLRTHIFVRKIFKDVQIGTTLFPELGLCLVSQPPLRQCEIGARWSPEYFLCLGYEEQLK